MELNKTYILFLYYILSYKIIQLKSIYKNIDGLKILICILLLISIFTNGIHSQIKVDDSNLLPFSVGYDNEEKWGFKDTKGNIILKPIYDFVYDYYNGFAIFRNRNTYGFINKSGKEITKNKYPDVRKFSNGLAVVWDGKYVYIDTLGKEVSPTIFDDAYDFDGNHAKVFNCKDYYYMNKNGIIYDKKRNN